MFVIIFQTFFIYTVIEKTFYVQHFLNLRHAPYTSPKYLDILTSPKHVQLFDKMSKLKDVSCRKRFFFPVCIEVLQLIYLCRAYLPKIFTQEPLVLYYATFKVKFEFVVLKTSRF
jgi:hypothetical protein